MARWLRDQRCSQGSRHIVSKINQHSNQTPHKIYSEGTFKRFNKIKDIETFPRWQDSSQDAKDMHKNLVQQMVGLVRAVRLERYWVAKKLSDGQIIRCRQRILRVKKLDPDSDKFQTIHIVSKKINTVIKTVTKLR